MIKTGKFQIANLPDVARKMSNFYVQNNDTWFSSLTESTLYIILSDSSTDGCQKFALFDRILTYENYFLVNTWPKCVISKKLSIVF